MSMLLLPLIGLVVLLFAVGRQLDIYEKNRMRYWGNLGRRHWAWMNMKEVEEQIDWHPEYEPIFLWTHPNGDVWEFRHTVTQTEAEGPEYTEVRVVGLDMWHIWSPNHPLPREVEEHFFGTVDPNLGWSD